MIESAARLLDGLPWLAITVTSFVVMFPIVLVHELGHALVALWRTDGPVIVVVGHDRGRTTCALGRTTFRLDPLVSLRLLRGRNDPPGVCWHLQSRRRLDRVAISLGGPLASLLLSAVAAVIALSSVSYTTRVVLVVVALESAVAGLMSLVPKASTYRGGVRLRSDGQSILDELRGQPVPVRLPAQRLWIHPTPRPATDQPAAEGTTPAAEPPLLRPPGRAG